MNYKDIPLHRRQYILEDIDAADLKDVVGQRSKNESKETDTKNEEDKKSDNKESYDSGIDLNFLNMLKSSATYGPWEKKSKKLTLATLLEVLDGVMEMDGRMLIITTNYPEKLRQSSYQTRHY